jgi:hypothetical protein
MNKMEIISVKAYEMEPRTAQGQGNNINTFV